VRTLLTGDVEVSVVYNLLCEDCRPLIPWHFSARDARAQWQQGHLTHHPDHKLVEATELVMVDHD
jgi:hypothetical protein